MSYCRFGSDGSDVYVFEHYLGFLQCCGCKLDAGGPQSYGSYETTSRNEMIAHLRQHQAIGHTVPSYAFDDLESEIRDFADEVNPPNDEPLARDPLP